jgi:uncharacterized phage protein (TIGR01671 family)
MTTSGIMFNSSSGILEVPKGANMKIMQFTGLKDINGKDIYEGNILQIDTGFTVEVKWSDYYNAFMGFSASGSWFLNDCKYPQLGILHGIDTGFKVIGNIHENNNYIKVDS